MRTTVSLAALLLAGSIGNALAADLPVKAPFVQPIETWTGFYVGLHAGYAWGGSATATVTPALVVPAGATVLTGPTAPFTLSTKPDGWLAGLQGGYNWQLNQIVVGIEADISFSKIDDTASGPYAVSYRLNNVTTVAGTVTLSEDVDWFGTLRARFGFLPTQTFLLYVTGGLAWGQINLSLTETNVATTTPPGTVVTTISTATADRTRFGYALGFGGEWMINPRWTLRGEYLWIDLRNSVTLTTPSAVATSSHTGLHIARAAVNLRFPP